MLKQIKTLGLSLVIGSMLVTSLPVYNNDCYAMSRPNISAMSEEDRVVEMYKYMCNDVYGEECTDKEETMVRKYFKYRTIKELAYRDAEEWQKEKEFQSNNGYIDAGVAISHLDIPASCLEEIFPNIEKMNNEQQRVLRFMYAYKFNRHLNVKNTMLYCTDCKTEYITDKYAKMLGEEKLCCCDENMPVSKLTVNGAKASVSRHYKNMHVDCKVTAEDNGDEIIVYVVRNNKKTSIFINKDTRVVINKITGPMK